MWPESHASNVGRVIDFKKEQKIHEITLALRTLPLDEIVFLADRFSSLQGCGLRGREAAHRIHIRLLVPRI